MESESDAYQPMMALAHWSENIRPTLGDLPVEGLRYLRDQYVSDVAANAEAQRQVVVWWFSSRLHAPARGSRPGHDLERPS